jgi:hypothetical protein
MAAGESAQDAIDAFDEIVNSLSRQKKLENFGNMNEVYCFFRRKHNVSPTREPAKNGKK